MEIQVNNKTHQHLLLLAVFAFPFLLYTNSIFNDYNMDDELVTQGHRLTSKGISAIPEIFTSPYYEDEAGNAYEYRPMVLTSFAIEHSFFGENAHVSHSINVLIYSLTCLLLFIALRLLFSGYTLALPLIATLLFAAHPIHTEVVASIKNRDELLSLLGGIGALYFALKYVDTKKWFWPLLMIISFLMGVLSKQSISVLAVGIPLTVVLFRSTSYLNLALISLPLVLIMTFFLPIYYMLYRILLVLGATSFPLIFNFFLYAPSPLEQVATKVSTVVIGLGWILFKTLKKLGAGIAGLFQRVFRSVLNFIRRGLNIGFRGTFMWLKQVAISIWRFPAKMWRNMFAIKSDAQVETTNDGDTLRLPFQISSNFRISIKPLFYPVFLVCSLVAALIGLKWGMLLLFFLFVFMFPFQPPKGQKWAIGVIVFMVILISINFKIKILVAPVVCLLLFAVYFGNQNLRKISLWLMAVYSILIILLAIGPLDAKFYQSLLLELTFSVIIMSLHFFLVRQKRWRKFSFIVPLAILFRLTGPPFPKEKNDVFISHVQENLSNGDLVKEVYTSLNPYWLSSLIMLILLTGVLLLTFKRELRKFAILVPLFFLLGTSITGAYFSDFAQLDSSSFLKEIWVGRHNLSQTVGVKINEIRNKLSSKAVTQIETVEKAGEEIAERQKEIQQVISKGTEQISGAAKDNVSLITTTPAPEILPQVGRKLSFVETPLVEVKDWKIRIGTSSYVLGKYLQLMFIPYPLSFYYGYKHIPLVGISNWFVLLSIVVHVILIILFFALLKKYRIISLGILLYLIGIAPFSNFVAPIAGLLGERLSYVASLGFCITLSALILRVTKQRIDKEEYTLFFNKTLIAVLGVLILAYSTQTFARNLKWENHLTLFQNDIKHLENSSRAHHLLATHLVFNSSKEGDINKKQATLREAEKHFKKSLDIYPKFPYAWFDLGRTYAYLGDNQRALKSFINSTKVDTGYAPAWLNAAAIYEELGDFPNAIDYYEQSIALNNQQLEAYSGLSFVYFKQEKYDSSIAVNERAMAALPNRYEPVVNIAKTYYNLGQNERAIEYFERAYKLNPQDQELLNFIINYYQSRNPEKASSYKRFRK